MASGALSIVGRRYRIYLKDPYDQVGIVEGELVRTDTPGFFVFLINGKVTLIPTERILEIEEI